MATWDDKNIDTGTIIVNNNSNKYYVVLLKIAKEPIAMYSNLNQIVLCESSKSGVPLTNSKAQILTQTEFNSNFRAHIVFRLPEVAAAVPAKTISAKTRKSLVGGDIAIPVPVALQVDPDNFVEFIEQKDTMSLFFEQGQWTIKANFDFGDSILPLKIVATGFSLSEAIVDYNSEVDRCVGIVDDACKMVQSFKYIKKEKTDG